MSTLAQSVKKIVDDTIKTLLLDANKLSAIAGDAWASLHKGVNVFVRDSAPTTDADTGDVWVDSDYNADVGKGYFLGGSRAYQAWTGYPDSPALSSLKPYQAIAYCFASGGYNYFLGLAETPLFFYAGGDNAKYLKEANTGSIAVYKLVDGAWVLEGEAYGAFYVGYSNQDWSIPERNHDIYNFVSQETLSCAKTTTTEQDAGTIWKPIACDAEDVPYDNTTSGLTATNVQAAIDELATSTAPVDSVNGATGAVMLDGSDLLLTSYTIAGSASAVASTDTINEAFGKLQKTVDGVETLLAGI